MFFFQLVSPNKQLYQNKVKCEITTENTQELWIKTHIVLLVWIIGVLLHKTYSSLLPKTNLNILRSTGSI